MGNPYPLQVRPSTIRKKGGNWGDLAWGSGRRKRAHLNIARGKKPALEENEAPNTSCKYPLRAAAAR